ncbi:ABC transporter permease [Leptospira gomenensis]|uniref:ABC transporter permease n=1 Tax=Leptospira gomenensis TaxID=2484974 RepID=A0A5F1Y6G0_9LEPT|nr:FtsX-like permease family protein [Leptospira gomenensis]TGK28809.1 ABC transporter permease [Leptospira gomenensis]TGK40985.1 ABC transporter permease [Leptospira gomenensis]TGK46163.1 ABC transporter permease [Leptospira gomenensis]TGK54688.1 ABC transporter permease [Leptospira gomenensis]
MFFISLRQMSARGKQTLTTLFGIVLGTAAFIIISGVLLGFRGYLVDQLINADCHVRVSSRQEIIRSDSMDDLFPNENVFWLSPPSGKRGSSHLATATLWYERLEADSEVQAYSPQVSGRIFLFSGANREAGKIIGIVPNRQIQITPLSDYIIEGSVESLSAGNRIVLGEGLAQLLGLRLNKTVWITAGQREKTPFRISGIFRSGNKALDDGVAYGLLSEVQQLTDQSGRITDIAVRLKDVNRSLQKADEWRQFGEDKITSWQEANSSFFAIFKLQDAIRYSMTAAILTVAGFGIYNILNVIINQKKREIAILRSIGYRPGDVLLIFLLQGIVLGVAGGLFGLLLGFLICLRIESMPFTNPLFSAGGGTMVVSFAPSIYVQAFLQSLAATIIASVIPARYAGKLSPIEIIRGE